MKSINLGGFEAPELLSVAALMEEVYNVTMYDTSPDRIPSLALKKV
jgi:hypothetical protein